VLKVKQKFFQNVNGKSPNVWAKQNHRLINRENADAASEKKKKKR
jgi:hypothetical protein